MSAAVIKNIPSKKNRPWLIAAVCIIAAIILLVFLAQTVALPHFLKNNVFNITHNVECNGKQITVRISTVNTVILGEYITVEIIADEGNYVLKDKKRDLIIPDDYAVTKTYFYSHDGTNMYFYDKDGKITFYNLIEGFSLHIDDKECYVFEGLK